VAFAILASGPAVTTGEDSLYSALTGVDAGCLPSGLSEEEIDARVSAAGPSGFDPLPYLETIEAPTLWQYCTEDLNIPHRQSVARLDSLRALGKDFTIQTFPNCNHNFIEGGGICETEGPRVDWPRPMLDWLLPVLSP
jgi:pimeloyl-ACP methyl ester carboxylesterase